jgi:hypothetical protein
MPPTAPVTSIGVFGSGLAARLPDEQPATASAILTAAW